MSVGFKYLTQVEAADLDDRLMGEEGGYSVDQLMELAGLSCATAIEKEYPQREKKFVVVCGPGNNGGDGLVAARHLTQFGYKGVTVVYPKEPKLDLYCRLIKQVKNHNVEVMTSLPSPTPDTIYVDAIFGFSFKPPMREPYASSVAAMKATSLPVIAIDIPSGWDVEKGDINKEGLPPTMLISLTAPKLCAATFKGTHYLGGRFTPPGFHPNVPQYPSNTGSSQILKLSSL